jgi:hypothetical protein
MEPLLIGVLCCAAIVPVAVVLGRLRIGDRTGVRALVLLWLGLTLLIVATQFLWAKGPLDGETAVTNRPIQAPTGNYVGSAACRSCHPHQHGTWYDSYHRTMTQVATEKSVLGDFENVRLQGNGLSVKLFRQGKQFIVEMHVQHLKTTFVTPVVMTTGSHNRQAYWLATGEHSRALTILPYMFLLEEQKWIPRHSGYINPRCLEEYPELAVLKADNRRWENACIRCHTTHGRRDAEADKAGPTAGVSGTQAVEFGISCEACHGPGAEHVRVNSNPLRRYERRLAGGPDASIVNPARLPHDRSSEVCGQCHSVVMNRSHEAHQEWLRNGNTYRPGQDLSADRLNFIIRGRSDLMPAERPPEWRIPVENGAFWSDGMIRASGREYNGLLDSPCFQRGQMSCLSCHRMHQASDDPRKRHEWADDQLGSGMEGNAACVQCHEKFTSGDQLTRHTHHAADSPGSNCYNCHMPFTTYGILKAIRSHQISSPSVQQSLQTGRPNACNQCHQDKTLAWTADLLARRHQIPKPKLSEDERRIAATALWALRGDAAQRALMAWSYGWADARAASGSHWQVPYLAQLLEDRYDAVRIIAHRSLRSFPGFRDVTYDPVGPVGQRASARRRVREIWASARQSSKRPFAPAILIDEKGQVLESEFDRLWGQRDDRAMTINE